MEKDKRELHHIGNAVFAIKSQHKIIADKEFLCSSGQTDRQTEIRGDGRNTVRWFNISCSSSGRQSKVYESHRVFTELRAQFFQYSNWDILRGCTKFYLNRWLELRQRRRHNYGNNRSRWRSEAPERHHNFNGRWQWQSFIATAVCQHQTSCYRLSFALHEDGDRGEVGKHNHQHAMQIHRLVWGGNFERPPIFEGKRKSEEEKRRTC